jgi:outer membrane biogenesis lipoprotein LolB
MRHLLLAIALLCLTSCATTSTHQFATPTSAWKTRAGQLAYRGPQMSLIGEVLVRTSPAGDVELTFSNAPALTLMTIRQDAQFASAEGPLARGRWAGEAANAPERLRGWFALREKILAGGKSVQVTNGAESFNLRF